MRFQLLTAASLKIAVFWDIAPWCHEVVVSEVRTAYKTLVYFKETKRRYIPKGCNIQEIKCFLEGGKGVFGAFPTNSKNSPNKLAMSLSPSFRM